MREEITWLGIIENVRWLGFLEGDEKWRALASCDVLVMPSYSESFGLSAVEALACGTPVIISDQVLLHDEIAQASVGLVVPCETDALANAILEMAQNAGMRRTMGERERAPISEQFNDHQTAARLFALYKWFR